MEFPVPCFRYPPCMVRGQTALGKNIVSGLPKVAFCEPQCMIVGVADSRFWGMDMPTPRGRVIHRRLQAISTDVLGATIRLEDASRGEEISLETYTIVLGGTGLLGWLRSAPVIFIAVWAGRIPSLDTPLGNTPRNFRATPKTAQHRERALVEGRVFPVFLAG